MELTRKRPDGCQYDIDVTLYGINKIVELVYKSLNCKFFFSFVKKNLIFFGFILWQVTRFIFSCFFYLLALLFFIDNCLSLLSVFCIAANRESRCIPDRCVPVTESLGYCVPWTIGPLANASHGFHVLWTLLP